MGDVGQHGVQVWRQQQHLVRRVLRGLRPAAPALVLRVGAAPRRRARVGARGRDARGGPPVVAGQRRRVLHPGEVRLLIQAQLSGTRTRGLATIVYNLDDNIMHYTSIFYSFVFWIALSLSLSLI